MTRQIPAPAARRRPLAGAAGVVGSDGSSGSVGSSGIAGSAGSGITDAHATNAAHVAGRPAPRPPASIADTLEDIAADAACLTRTAPLALRNLEALLPEEDRSLCRRLAQTLRQALAQGRLFDDPIATEFETLALAVEQRIEAGVAEVVVFETSEEWCGIGDGAWLERHMTDEARALQRAWTPLARLRDRIAQIRDHAAGERALMRHRQHG